MTCTEKAERGKWIGSSFVVHYHELAGRNYVMCQVAEATK